MKSSSSTNTWRGMRSMETISPNGEEKSKELPNLAGTSFNGPSVQGLLSSEEDQEIMEQLRKSEEARKTVLASLHERKV